MKTKYLLLLFSFMLFSVSCSDDDDYIPTAGELMANELYEIFENKNIDRVYYYTNGSHFKTYYSPYHFVVQVDKALLYLDGEVLNLEHLISFSFTNNTITLYFP